MPKRKSRVASNLGRLTKKARDMRKKRVDEDFVEAERDQQREIMAARRQNDNIREEEKWCQEQNRRHQRKTYQVSLELSHGTSRPTALKDSAGLGAVTEAAGHDNESSLMSSRLKEEDISSLEFEGSSSGGDDATLENVEDADEATAHFSSSLVVKPEDDVEEKREETAEKMEQTEEEEEEEENWDDFDVDEFLKSTSEQASDHLQFQDLDTNGVSESSTNCSVNRSVVKGIYVGGHIYPLQLVPHPLPTSSLPKIKFSLRYMYKNVLTSEQNCIGWLATHGLLPSEQTCKICATPMILVRDRTSWRCRSCRTEFCIRKGTFFKEKRFPLTTILELLYWWSLNTKHNVIFRELDVSRPAIGTWFQYCRQLCEQFFKDHPCRLGGPGLVVEVGDYDFTSRRSESSQRVLGMVERGNNNSVFLTVIPDRFPQTLFDYIDEVVLPGTKVMAKAAPYYRQLCERSDLQFVGPGEPDFGVDGIARLWSYLQDSLRRKKGIRDQLFKCELKEIQFRLLMGDRLFGELLFWLDFYHW